MHFIKPLLLLATTVSALTINVPRDTARILSNLATIDRNTKSLTTTVTNWDGSLLGALGINGAVSTLKDSISTATTNANSETVVATSAQSQQVIAYINNTLEPDIVKSLAALEAKKPQFESAGLKATALQSLKDLQTGTAGLAAALKKVTSSDQLAAADAAQAKINADFNKSIASFS